MKCLDKVPVEESLNLSCCRFRALKSVPTGQNRPSDSSILGNQISRSSSSVIVAFTSRALCTVTAEVNVKNGPFPLSFQTFPRRRWKMSHLATSVILPSLLSSRRLSLQLEEPKPSPPSPFICSVAFRCYGTALAAAFDLQLGLWQLMMACACKRVSISGEHRREDNALFRTRISLKQLSAFLCFLSPGRTAGTGTCPR